MPRLGLNPARGRVSAYKPSRVTLCMITYLPEQSGYFRDRLDVIRLSLDSLIATAPDCDLMVFDNGSVPALVDHLRGLRDAGKIDYLLLSTRNVGKIGAFQIMFPAAPGEWIAYADDDIYFLPGWLEESLRIAEAFPRVGMVSGYYVRTQMTYGIESTLRFAGEPGVEVRRGRFLAEEWERHYVENYGRDWERHLAETAGVEDILLTRAGVQAFVSAQHMQFLAPKQALLGALPREWSGRLMGQMRELDSEVDRLGYLRLSTAQPYTRFIGNVVSPQLAAEAAARGLTARGTVRKKPRHPLRFLLRIDRVNAWLWKLHGRLFDLLNSRDEE